MSNQTKQKVVVPILTFLAGEREGDQVAISSTRFTVGRDPSCDLVLTDMSVSAQHAEIRCEKNIWSVRDMGSSNGTTHNGSPTSLSIIKNGDRIGFGDLLFRFNTPPPQTLALASVFNPRDAKNLTAHVEVDSAISSSFGDSSVDLSTTVNLSEMNEGLAGWLSEQVALLREEMKPWTCGHREGVLEGLLISLLCGGHLRLYGLPDTGMDHLLSAFCQKIGLRLGIAPFAPTESLQCEVVLADSSTCLDDQTRALVAGSRDGRLAVVPALFVLRCPPGFRLSIPAHWFLLSVPITEGTAEEETALANTLLLEKEEGHTIDFSQLDRVQFALREAARTSPLLPLAVELTRRLRPGAEASADIQQHIIRGPGVASAADLILAAQARAALRGVATPNVGDVKAVAPLCFIHRIRLHEGARVNVLRLIEAEWDKLITEHELL